MEKLTLKQYLSYNRDDDDIFSAFYSLDRQLEQIHNKGFYVTKMNADSIMYLDSFEFVNIQKIDNKSIKSDVIAQNIKDLIKLSLGVYVSLDMGENVFYDYTKLGDNFVIENYNWIRSSIPDNTEYYDQIINSEVFGGALPVEYLNKFKNQNNISINSSNVLQKSTAAGRAFSDNEESAFINGIFYPVIIGCILLCIAVVYLLYKYM